MSAVITISSPALTTFDGMLSTPADSPFFNDCTSTFFCEEWGGRPLCLPGESSVLLSLHWSCDRIAQSSILSIGSVFLIPLQGIFLSGLE